MKYYFALCDDEREHLNILEARLYKIMSKLYEEVDIDTYQSGKELIKCIEKQNKDYDIIFLDMQMPVKNGVEIGKIIRKFDDNVIIIYITGYVDYALNAFEIRAFDYLLKPVNSNQLKKTIEEALKRIEINNKYQNDTQCLFTFSYNKTVTNIKLEDIIFIEKLKNKVIITCMDRQYDVYDSLENIKKKLNEDLFIQTHQGFIVNKKKIDRYEKQSIILTLGYVIPVSRNKCQYVKKAFFEGLR